MTTQPEPTPHTQDATIDALQPPWVPLLDGTWRTLATSMNEKPERWSLRWADTQNSETLIAQLAPVTKNSAVSPRPSTRRETTASSRSAGSPGAARSECEPAPRPAASPRRSQRSQLRRLKLLVESAAPSPKVEPWRRCRFGDFSAHDLIVRGFGGVA
jgi:hypothetical protein